MRSGSVLHEPLLTSCFMAAEPSQCSPEASKHIHISISCNSLRCPVFVTEPKRSNNSLCTQSYPRCSLCNMKIFFRSPHLVSQTPNARSSASSLYHWDKSGLHHWTTPISKSLPPLSLVLRTRHTWFFSAKHFPGSVLGERKCGMVSFLNYVSKFDELRIVTPQSSALLLRTDFFGVASTDMRTAAMFSSHLTGFVTNWQATRNIELLIPTSNWLGCWYARPRSTIQAIFFAGKQLNLLWTSE